MLVLSLIFTSKFYPQDNNENPEAISSKKNLLLTFQTSIGRGPYFELEFGARLSHFLLDLNNTFNLGINFNLCYLIGKIEKSQTIKVDYTTQHYFSLALMPFIYISGYYLSGGIGANFRFAGSDINYGSTNTVTYNKTFYTINIEMGYFYISEKSKFTFSVVLYGKFYLTKPFSYQNPVDEKGGSGGLRVQLGLNLF
jgi:hypothetical protein